MAKVTDEQLRVWRELGVKSIGFFEGELATVEFFPRGLLDVTNLLPDADSQPTDRPPPPVPEDDQPNHVPPAIARILAKGSVS